MDDFGLFFLLTAKAPTDKATDSQRKSTNKHTDLQAFTSKAKGAKH